MRVLRTEVFDTWLAALADAKVKTAVLVRIHRLASGNAGDVRNLSDGVSELRIHIGAGWRLYFVRRGAELIILLCGGSKRSQARDIVKAKGLAARYKEMQP